MVKLKEHIDTHTLKHLIKGKLTHTHRYVCMYFKIMHTHHNVNLSLLIVSVPFNRKEREFTQKKTAAHKYHEKTRERCIDNVCITLRENSMRCRCVFLSKLSLDIKQWYQKIEKLGSFQVHTYIVLVLLQFY